ncbi:MAG: PD40 domain-containing protein [Myxococcales bacterium]|nr:PD40 domain-containing protein [Myxococcales bacterium]MCB9706379.1 PD40 domain-containing protein [Myxococcales bacterium]
MAVGALGVASAGCILDNPVFGGLGETAVDTVSTSAATTTGIGTTGDGTTSDGTTSGGTSTSGSGSSSGTTGGATATTGESTGLTSSSSSGDPTTGTTGGPADCWGMPIDSWTWTEIPDGNLGVGPHSPRISPDGYTLYYTAGDPGRPHVSTRADLDAPFVDGVPMVMWGSIDGNDHVAIRGAVGEMILSGKKMMGQPDVDVLVSVKGGNWALPVSLVGVTTPSQERSPTINEDGSRLIFERLSNDVNPVLGNVWRFYEAKRKPDTPAGTAFQTATLMVIDGVTNDAYVHPTLCAALSPDGLRLFFGSSYPDPINPADHVDALYINVVERDSLDAPWDAKTITRLTTLQEEGWQTCPHAITSDGCQISFGRFFFTLNQEPVPPDKVRNFLGKRGG